MYNCYYFLKCITMSYQITFLTSIAITVATAITVEKTQKKIYLFLFLFKLCTFIFLYLITEKCTKHGQFNAIILMKVC